jgi:hypothetical protein
MPQTPLVREAGLLLFGGAVALLIYWVVTTIGTWLSQEEDKKDKKEEEEDDDEEDDDEEEKKDRGGAGAATPAPPTQGETLEKYLNSAFVMLGLGLVVYMVSDSFISLFDWKVDKDDSAGYTAVQLMRNEFLIFAGVTILVVGFVSLFFDRSKRGASTRSPIVDWLVPGVDFDQPDYYQILDLGANVLVALMLVYGMVLFLQTLRTNAGLREILFHTTTREAKRVGSMMSNAMHAGTFDARGKHWDGQKWKRHGNYTGLVMSGDSRLMPSFREKVKAGGGRDLYRENRDELDAEIYRERRARQGHRPLHHEGGGYTDKLMKAEKAKRGPMEAFVQNHFPVLANS